MIGEKLAQNWPGDASPMRDDRVLRATRITAAVLVPVLLTAGVILYLFPDDTERLFELSQSLLLTSGSRDAISIWLVDKA